MRVTIICSDVSHPVNAYLKAWTERHGKDHTIALVRNKNELAGGDILFMVSCREIIGAAERAGYGGALVLHASDLPQGRGWNPQIWELAAGSSHLTLTLLQAADVVDSGRVWATCTSRFKSEHFGTGSTSPYLPPTYLLWTSRCNNLETYCRRSSLRMERKRSAPRHPKR